MDRKESRISSKEAKKMKPAAWWNVGLLYHPPLHWSLRFEYSASEKHDENMHSFDFTDPSRAFHFRHQFAIFKGEREKFPDFLRRLGFVDGTSSVAMWRDHSHHFIIESGHKDMCECFWARIAETGRDRCCCQQCVITLNLPLLDTFIALLSSEKFISQLHDCYLRFFLKLLYACYGLWFMVILIMIVKYGSSAGRLSRFYKFKL